MSEDKGVKCDGCGKTFTTPEFEANLYVCPKCGSHEKMPARKRIEATVPDKAANTAKVQYLYGRCGRICDGHKREGRCVIPGETCGQAMSYRY